VRCEVIILESTSTTGERKINTSVFLNVKLRLQLKQDSLFPMHDLRFRIDRIYFPSSNTPNPRILCEIVTHSNQLSRIQHQVQLDCKPPHLKHYSYHICCPNQVTIRRICLLNCRLCT
jgi:hypothetical protein